MHNKLTDCYATRHNRLNTIRCIGIITGYGNAILRNNKEPTPSTVSPKLHLSGLQTTEM
jgi:hypothetical protein